MSASCQGRGGGGLWRRGQRLRARGPRFWATQENSGTIHGISGKGGRTLDHPLTAPTKRRQNVGFALARQERIASSHGTLIERSLSLIPGR